GEIGDGAAVIIIWRSSIEEIVVNVRGDHDELINETDEQRLILAGPSIVHGFLQNVVAHTVGDHRDLGFAGFGRGLFTLCVSDNGFQRVPLFLDKPIEKLAKNIGKILSAFASVRAIWIISEHVPIRWPIETDAE